MTLAVLTAQTRLAPPEAATTSRRRRVLGGAIGAAVLAHLLFGATLVFLHPAGRAIPAALQPPAQTVPIEIENDVGTSSDAPVGGQTGQQNAKGGAPPPQPQATAASPPPPPQSDTPDMLKAPDGEVAPPQPQPTDSTQTAPTPTPPQPTQTAQQPTDAQASRQEDPGPEIRLATSDDEGVSGGTADKPAAADPKVRNKLPAYPISAAQRAQQGSVQMFAHVGPDGLVQTVVIANSSGSASLDAAALRAVRKWKFKPATAHGVPVASDVPVAFNFVLH